MKEQHFFYSPQARHSDCLPDEEYAHAVRVLRLGVGDEIHLMDGHGSFFTALIVEANKKYCKYEILSEQLTPREKNSWFHVAVAPTKNIDRMEWFVEKAVEIGVDEITFLNTDFAERKKVNLDRMERISVSAMKQSRKPYKTLINGITDFKDLVTNVRQEHKFICHCYADDNEVLLAEKQMLRNLLLPEDKAIVLVGPEGDFSLKEVLLAQNEGFIPVSLGDSRLRTETAALVAVHILNLFT